MKRLTDKDKLHMAVTLLREIAHTLLREPDSDAHEHCPDHKCGVYYNREHKPECLVAKVHGFLNAQAVKCQCCGRIVEHAEWCNPLDR
jgi:hypothetical protein